MRGFRRGAPDHHVQAFFLRPEYFLFERLLAVVIDGQVADDLEQVAELCLERRSSICGADWSLKNASWTTSSARERQPVRAAIFARSYGYRRMPEERGYRIWRVDSCSDMEITLWRGCRALAVG